MLGSTHDDVPWRLRDVAAVFLLTVLGGIGASLSARGAVAAGWLSARAAQAVLLPVSPALLGSICWGYVAFRFPGAAPRLLGRVRAAGSEVAFGVGLGVVAIVVQILLLAGARLLVDLPLEQMQAPLRQAALDSQLRPFLILGAVILAPLGEELFFRGMAYRALRKRVGVAGGATASAAFFAGMHLTPGGVLSVNVVLFVVIFLLGLLLAWLLERRRSLVGPMALHATFNLLSLGALLLEAAEGS